MTRCIFIVLKRSADVYGYKSECRREATNLISRKFLELEDWYEYGRLHKWKPLVAVCVAHHLGIETKK